MKRSGYLMVLLGLFMFSGFEAKATVDVKSSNFVSLLGDDDKKKSNKRQQRLLRKQKRKNRKEYNKRRRKQLQQNSSRFGPAPYKRKKDYNI